ncbi:MAG: hypothetical protein GY944_01540 [bacterium]|nr:hypothetical protein [bacterium]
MSNDNEAVSDNPPRLSDLLAPLVLVVFAFGWVYGVGGASTRIMQSYHGLHHAAYVVQLTNGIIPPTNPSSAEAPANFYWAWHAALAMGVRFAGVTPFEMSLSSNALGLASFLCGFWLAAGAFTRNGWLRLAACGIPLFILNPLGLVQFAVRLAGVWLPELFATSALQGDGLGHLVEIARHHGALQMTDQNLAQLFPRLGLFDGFALSDRAGHLINKFLNFNSFPLALGVFALAQDGLVNQRATVGVRTAGLAAACFAMAVFSPVVVVAFGLTGLAYLLIEGPAQAHALRKAGFASRRKAVASFVAPMGGCGLGVIAALPFVLPIAAAYDGGAQLLMPGMGLWRHTVVLGWALVPAAILLGLAAWLGRYLESAGRVHALSLSFYAVAAITLVAPLRDPNEYKFVLLSSFPSSLLVLGLLNAWARKSQVLDAHLRSPRLFASVFAAGGALAIGSMALLYLASPWAQEDPLQLEGATTRLAVARDAIALRDLDDAYAWLREETPKDAYVFEVAVSKDASRLPVVAERRVVVQTASAFTQVVEHHDALLDANATLLADLAACSLAESTLATLRALPISWPSAPYALVEKGAGQRECESVAGAPLLYANERFAIRRINALVAAPTPPAP